MKTKTPVRFPLFVLLCLLIGAAGADVPGTAWLDTAVSTDIATMSNGDNVLAHPKAQGGVYGDCTLTASENCVFWGLRNYALNVTYDLTEAPGVTVSLIGSYANAICSYAGSSTGRDDPKTIAFKGGNWDVSYLQTNGVPTSWGYVQIGKAGECTYARNTTMTFSDGVNFLAPGPSTSYLSVGGTSAERADPDEKTLIVTDSGTVVRLGAVNMFYNSKIEGLVATGSRMSIIVTNGATCYMNSFQTGTIKGCTYSVDSNPLSEVIVDNATLIGTSNVGEAFQTGVKEHGSFNMAVRNGAQVTLAGGTRFGQEGTSGDQIVTIENSTWSQGKRCLFGGAAARAGSELRFTLVNSSYTIGDGSDAVQSDTSLTIGNATAGARMYVTNSTVKVGQNLGVGTASYADCLMEIFGGDSQVTVNGSMTVYNGNTLRIVAPSAWWLDAPIRADSFTMAAEATLDFDLDALDLYAGQEYPLVYANTLSVNAAVLTALNARLAADARTANMYVAVEDGALMLKSRVRQFGPSEVAALRTALTNGLDNGTIVQLAAGTFELSALGDIDVPGSLILGSGSSLTIRGATGNPADVVLRGDGSNRILALSKNCGTSGLLISGITFDGGDCSGYANTAQDVDADYGYGRGGAISIRSAPSQTIVISNCVFRGCKAKAGGGAIAHGAAAGGAMYDLYDCTFENCDGGASGAGGGAVFGARHIVRCRFAGCHVSGGDYGGSAVSVPVSVTDCVFTNNYFTGTASAYRGGAIFLTTNGSTMVSAFNAAGGKLRISGSKFYNNGVFTADTAISGAAVFGSKIGSGCVAISNCVFRGNDCGYHAKSQWGGAVFMYSAPRDTVTIYDSLFDGNHAVAEGGAVRYAICYRCEFRNNTVGMADYTSGGSGGAGAYVDAYFCTNYEGQCSLNSTRSGNGVTQGAHGSEFRWSNLRGCVFRNLSRSRAEFEALGLGNASNDNSRIFRDCSLDGCVIDGVKLDDCNYFLLGSEIAVTNTVISNCRGLCYLTSGPECDGSYVPGFVNNTIVSNDLVNLSNHADRSPITGLDCVNCFFYGNRWGGSSAFDMQLSHRNVTGDRKFFNRFVNCIFAGSGEPAEGTVVGCINYYGNAAFAPGFTLEEGAPYALKKSSPARRQGLVQDWMNSATDVLGNPRLYNGLVDIGACQSQAFPNLGAVLIFQ